MVTFPNGKINIGLHIISKRADGYHNLETVFYPFPVYDALEIVEAQQLSLQQYGIAINGDNQKNLCLLAYHLLKSDFPQLPPVSMCLLKNIPMGAGLGGGSADGAFMLCMLNTLFNLNIALETLLNYALRLGSDCPFFVLNKPCYATGRGEVLQPVNLDLSNFTMVLVNPGIHVSTKEAFSGILPKPSVKPLTNIVKQSIYTWKDELHNDFEIPVFKLYPAIKAVKEQLYLSGAIYAAMTGSGSTVYGIFEKGTLPKLSFPANYICITTP